MKRCRFSSLRQVKKQKASQKQGANKSKNSVKKVSTNYLYIILLQIIDKRKKMWYNNMRLENPNIKINIFEA